MHVAYYAPFAQKTGYAQAAHDYMLALHRAGVSLEIFPILDCDLDDLDERYEELIPLAQRKDGKKVTHTIAHTVPRGVPLFLPREPQSFARIAMTTWETSAMPTELSAGLDMHSDLILVPSLYCAEAIHGNGDTEIEVVPHCFDPAHWPAQSLPSSDSPFSFYSILGWSERKNPIGLLKAYLAEFSSADDVVLQLKVSGYSHDDLSALATATGIPLDELPMLEIIADHCDHEAMVEFHHANHCFVTAARAEGWNLPAFEAAILGKQVIAPMHGGQVDFLYGYANSRHYGHQLTPAISPPQVQAPIEIAGLDIIPIAQVAPSGISARQSWAEPDLYGLQRAMRIAYQARSPLDLSSREDFEKRYGYATVGAQLASILERTAK